jgi:hypothetical protein
MKRMFLWFIVWFFQFINGFFTVNSRFTNLVILYGKPVEFSTMINNSIFTVYHLVCVVLWFSKFI